MAAIAAMFFLFTASNAGAVDQLAQAKKLSAAATAFPELVRIKTQLDALIAGMQTHTEQLSAYRKARVRATDRRYSGLTQSLNRLRTQISELAGASTGLRPLHRALALGSVAHARRNPASRSTNGS